MSDDNDQIREHMLKHIKTQRQHVNWLASTSSRTIGNNDPPVLTQEERAQVEQQIAQLNDYRAKDDTKAFDQLFPQIARYVQWKDETYKLREDITGN